VDTAFKTQIPRERLSELLDEIGNTAGRLRGAVDELRPATEAEIKELRGEIASLRSELDALRARVEPLEAAPKPAPPVQAAPAATTTPAPSPAVSAAAKASFEALLIAHLDKHKRYPPEARMRRHQGTAYIQFTMDRQGRVLTYKLYRSSGSQHLDDEVLALIVRAQPLPPIPADRPENTLEFVVPVQFSLR
jgi:protein TonB